MGLQARDLMVHAAVPAASAIRLHTLVLDAVRVGDAAAAEHAMRDLLDVADVDASSTLRTDRPARERPRTPRRQRR